MQTTQNKFGTSFVYGFSLISFLALSGSSVTAAAATESVESGPTVSLSENREGEGFVPPEDEPVCPDEYGSGRAGVKVSEKRHCLKLDPKHVNADGTLRTGDFRRGSRNNSWKVRDKGAREWVDFWAEAYVFTGEKSGKYYKLCGCYRDYRRSGCFSPDTKITMSDGSEKSVREISAGEYVKNASNGEPAKVVRIIEGPEQHKLVEINAAGRTLKVSKEHPMLVFGAGTSVQTISLRSDSKLKGELLRADQLTPGMVLKLEDGSFAPIRSINRPEIEDAQYVVNFVLEANAGSDDSHMLISEGIVTGDLVLQRRLAKRQTLEAKTRNTK